MMIIVYVFTDALWDHVQVVTSLKECPEFNSGNPKLNLGCRSYSGMNSNIWTRFYLLYVLEESEVVARKSSLKKMYLKILQYSQENIFTRSGGLQLH